MLINALVCCAHPTSLHVQVGADPKELQHGSMHPSPAQVEGFVTHTFDLDKCRTVRAGWPVFRDRRPDLYGALVTLDGIRKHPGAH